MPQAPSLLAIGQYFLLGVGTKDEHHTSITKGITKSRQPHTTTAAGKSTIIPPFWVLGSTKPPHMALWEESIQSTSNSTISLSIRSTFHLYHMMP